MKMHIPTHSSSQFTYDKDTATFSADISDLRSPLCSRAFDDSADVGFNLKSEKTGKKVAVYFESEEYHHGDPVSWTFVPGTNTPEEGTFKVVIFND